MEESIKSIYQRFCTLPDRLDSININPNFYRTYVVTNHLYVLTALIHFSFIFLFIILGVKELALFNILSVLLWLFSLVMNLKGFMFAGFFLGNIEVVLHALLCTLLLGWESGFHYYILVFAVVAFPFALLGLMKTVILIAANSIVYALIYYLAQNSNPLHQLAVGVTEILSYVNILTFCGFLAVFGYYFIFAISKTEEALQEAQGKVEKAYSLLSKYVAPQLADKISDGQIDSIWKHHRKKLTLFFSDIRDFTSITDSMEPEDMANVLNEYLTEMNKIINEYKGTLAQVIGDGLYIFFGAPESSNDKDHALRCVKMGVDMQQKMNELNKRWFKRGIDEVLLIRCGINTGMATVGGYGSSERKEYTAMGMQTNIAARLEQTCEPGGILISHSTWALVNDEISCTEQGQFNVKGLKKPIRGYRVDAVAGETYNQ
jgi:class 3 adenylate cyclase